MRHACADKLDIKLPPLEPHRRVPIEPEVQRVLDTLTAWPQFLDMLRSAFPDCKTWDHSAPWHDPGYRCYVSQPGYDAGAPRDEIACMVSALAPVYVLFVHDIGAGPPTRVRYSQFAAKYRDREVRLAELVEATFQFSRLTEELVLMPVADVVPAAANRVMGEATVMDCLFTHHA